MCWVYSKQKITVIVAHIPQPCTKPHCSSHSTSTEEVNSHYVNTQGPVFRLALLSFMCTAKTFRVVSRVSEHDRKRPPRAFSPTDDGERHLSLLQIAELGEGPSKPTLFSGCHHYSLDVLAGDYLFSLVL